MKRSLHLMLITLFLAGSLCVAIEPPQASSFWKRVLNFFGVSSSPGRQRGPGDELKDGKIMIYDVQTAATRSRTSEGGYRSPIFATDDANIFAIKGERIVRIALTGGTPPEELFEVKGILKLVDVNINNPTEVLILTDAEHDNCPSVGVLSLTNGAVSYEMYTTDDDKKMVNHLQSWKREYDDGNTKFDIKLESKHVDSRDVEWTNVLFKQKDHEWINITRCDVPGISCGHPSISKNRKLIVFIQAI